MRKSSRRWLPESWGWWIMATFRVDEVGLEKFMRTTLRPWMKDKLADPTRDIAKGIAGNCTGRLRRSIEVEEGPLLPRDVTLKVVADTEYATWHHEGTRGPIRARGGGFLIFIPRCGVRRIVKAREVRGQPGTKYLARGLEAALARAGVA